MSATAAGAAADRLSARDALGFVVLAWYALYPLFLGGNRDWIWPWFAALAFALLAFTALAYARSRLDCGLLQCLPRTVLLLLLAWPASAALHLIGSPLDSAAAGDATLRDSAHVAMALLALVACESRRDLLFLAGGVVAIGTAQALGGALMALAGSAWVPVGERVAPAGIAVGTYVNRNHFAGLLALASGLGFGLLLARMATESAPDWRSAARRTLRAVLGATFWLRAALVVLLVGLVMSQSRLGNLALLGALLVGSLWALWRWKPRPRRLVLLLISIALLDLLIVGSWFGLERLAERIERTELIAAPAAGGSRLEPADAERLIVARATLELWRERPWLGHGPGGFRVGFPAVKPAPIAVFYDHAHNDWLQILAERGVVGFGLWLGLIGGAVFAGFRSVARRNARARGLALGGALGLLALALHGLGDFNWQIPANGALSLLLIALVGAAAGPVTAASQNGTFLAR
jgi:O-antigen ligase